MTSRSEMGLGPQAPFLEKDEQLILPFSITELKAGRQVIHLLERQKLWRDRPPGDALLLGLAHNQAVVFEPGSWAAKEVVDAQSLEKREDIAAVVIIAPELNVYKREEVIERVTELSSFLVYKKDKQGVMFVFEEKGEDKGTEWRDESLRQAILVDRQVLTSKSREYLIWRARLPKKRKARKPYDLLRKPTHEERIERLREKVRKDYKNNGYKVIDDSAIMAKLSESKYIIRDLGTLELGWGVVLEVDCGCQWEVDLSGIETPILHCPDSECDGIPITPEELLSLEEIEKRLGRDEKLIKSEDKTEPTLAQQSPEKLGDENEIYVLGIIGLEGKICGNCPTTMVRDAVREKRISDTHTRLLINEYCPSCGGAEEKRVVVPESKIQERR